MVNNNYENKSDNVYKTLNRLTKNTLVKRRKFSKYI